MGPPVQPEVFLEEVRCLPESTGFRSAALWPLANLGRFCGLSL